MAVRTLTNIVNVQRMLSTASELAGLPDVVNMINNGCMLLHCFYDHRHQ